MADMLRDYDLAFMAKLQAVSAPTGYQAAVTGIAGPVPVVFGLAEDWWATFQLPAIHVARVGLVPDPRRSLPRYRGVIPGTAPATLERQAGPSQPINYLYQVELAATQHREWNALVAHCLRYLPAEGYGTFLSVFGRLTPFQATGMQDLTDYTTKDGRVFRYVFTYAVEGWWADETDTEIVPQVTSYDITLERHETATELRSTPPPPVPTDPDAVVHIVGPVTP